MTPKLEHGPSPTDVSVRGKKDSQFPFLSLPSELRIKVYEQTLLSDTDRKPRNDFAIIRATYMSLSQTCKQIRSEVQHEAIGILNHYLYAVRRNWILAFDCSLHIRNSHILSFPQIAIGRVVFPTVASGTTQQREIGTHFCLRSRMNLINVDCALKGLAGYFRLLSMNTAKDWLWEVAIFDAYEINVNVTRTDTGKDYSISYALRRLGEARPPADPVVMALGYGTEREQGPRARPQTQ